MRELKFRAWDKEYKKMWWFDLMWGNTVAHGSGWIGMVDSPETEKYGVGILSDNRVQVDPIGKEIMQYTGLKDKNGKDIYEGDMLSVDGRNSGLPVVVIYEDGAFMGAYTDSTFKYPLSSVELHLQKTEVIGNVYENPELLTPENK